MKEQKKVSPSLAEKLWEWNPFVERQGGKNLPDLLREACIDLSEDELLWVIECAKSLRNGETNVNP
jgi:hypothetical protein